MSDSQSTPTAADVRTWARANGVQVGDRGRLSASLLASYTQATGQVYTPPSA